MLYQGEVARSVYYIVSGALKAYSINTQGEERIVLFYSKDDLFPIPWSVGSRANAQYYFEALTESELIIIPQHDLKSFTQSRPQAMQSIADYYIHAHTTAMMRINALEQAKASEKLTYTIFYLLQGYGQEIHEGVYKINISLTQQMIASLIGLTRETTANELLALKKKGVLSYKSQRYMVNRQKLLKLMGEESFNEL